MYGFRIPILKDHCKLIYSTQGINSMQNSIWRGAKLKIAPAKKSYEER